MLHTHMSKIDKKYKPVIGLEVHVELATNSKMFCGCPADHFAKEPNTQTCPVCLGLPGALPVPNKKAIDWCVSLGLALNCKINKDSNFDRKHYFYPDLPKGYQISQYEDPFCYGGYFEVNGKKIGITRVHMEEDTAKLQHIELKGKRVSLIDFNRSGVPLVELVTEPDFDNVEDIIAFLQELQRIVRYLGISTADMEKGSMRLEANISMSPDGKLPDYKVELKNINSFRFLKKAVLYEIERQTSILSSGEKLNQETRGWDELKSKTFTQRIKEEAKDYRYFPDPDIPPVHFEEKDVEKLRKLTPELPAEKRKRYKKDFDIPDNYVDVLVETSQRAQYFEEAVKLKPELAKTIAGLMVNKNMDNDYPEPAGLVKRIVELSKTEFSTNEETTNAVKSVIDDNLEVVKKYKEGQFSVLGFFIGQTQKLLKSKGDPKLIAKLVKEELES